MKKKEQWEEDAKDRFIAALKAEGRGNWIVSDTDVVVDKQTNRNFDYQLKCGNELIALEIFRLVENREEIIRSKSWSTIANGIAAELRRRGIKGYTIHTPYVFDVPRLKIPGFVSKTADQLEVAIKQNPQTDPILVDGFEINRIDGFLDVCLATIGPGGAINPAGTAYDFMAKKLPTKNKQLDIADHERVVLIVGWAAIVGRSDMIEACSLTDYSQFQNIDKVYFESPHDPGQVHLAYHHEIYAAFRPDGEPPKRVEPLFISWLAAHLYRKDIQAFQLVRKITEREKSLLWLPPLSREQLVAIGEDLLKSKQWEELSWIIQNLKNDPDPSVTSDLHLSTKQGKNNRLIQSVRGRLCWLLMQIVMQNRTEDYERILEIVEKFATEDNLYVRQQATFPLLELAKRRLAKVDANTRFMSDQLANRIKTLALRMLDENASYPVVLEALARVLLVISDLDHDRAIRTLERILVIEESEAASDISLMMIYFSFLREKQFKHLDPFKSDGIRNLLKAALANGSRHLRATAANHFKVMLERKEIEFYILIPYFEALMNGPSDGVVNHHFYEIAEKQAAAYPDAVGPLIERAVLGELKSLESGGREVWHPKSFSEALRVLEHTGLAHKERVGRIRESMEPYRKHYRMFDLADI